MRFEFNANLGNFIHCIAALFNHIRNTVPANHPWTGTRAKGWQLHPHRWRKSDVMPEKRHEMEAEKILAEMNAQMPNNGAVEHGRRLLAEALEQAERRGRQSYGSQKESSG